MWIDHTHGKARARRKEARVKKWRPPVCAHVRACVFNSLGRVVWSFFFFLPPSPSLLSDLMIWGEFFFFLFFSSLRFKALVVGRAEPPASGSDSLGIYIL